MASAPLLTQLWACLLLGSGASCCALYVNTTAPKTFAGCLQDFRASLLDTEQKLYSWNVSTQPDPCNWRGVQCRQPELVLDLAGFGLGGELQLRAFQGCASWTTLRLSGNDLSGSIPADVCSQNPSLVNLDLSYNYLSGPIPVGIGNCSFLESLLLQSNMLDGSIPEGLGMVATLKQLDLSHNLLTGTIPSDLLYRTQLDANFDGNSGLEIPPDFCRRFPGASCAPAPVPIADEAKSRSSSRRLAWILSAAAAVVALCAVVGVVVVARTRRSSRAVRARTGRVPVEVVFRRMGSRRGLKVRDIWAATGNFNQENKIGSGGFSTVYKATLPDGTVVAVKRLEGDSQLGHQFQERNFCRELTALVHVKHRNLVQILGYVAKADMKLLILEYMPNGSLERQLYGEVSLETGSHSADYVCPLTWQQRWNIALGVAMGLDYLHQDIRNPLVHLDLKPSNVLLDAGMVARISDFGLAKLVSQASITTQTVFWSVGYTAPEVFLGAGGTTRKADVYSFGIVLLELITKQRPTSSVFGEGVTLLQWVKLALESDALETVLDPALTTAGNHMAYMADITMLCRIGIFCAQNAATARPDMKTVVDILAKRGPPPSIEP